eukprot:1904184-Prymnesium_polylepis.1
MHEAEEFLARGACKRRLAHAVVVEVVGGADAKARPADPHDELGNPVELVHGGLEAEVHTREDEEVGATRGRVDDRDGGEAWGATRALPVRHLNVVGAAAHVPVAAQAEDVGEGGRDARREVRGVACDGLAEGGALVVEARRRVVAAAKLEHAAAALLLNDEARHGAPEPGTKTGVELVE